MKQTLKLLAGLTLFAVIVLVLWEAHYAGLPTLRAKVSYTGNVLTLTNGNDETWPSVRVTVIDSHGVPEAYAYDIRPGEQARLPIASFRRIANREPLDPAFDRVRSFEISVPGFQNVVWSR